MVANACIKMVSDILAMERFRGICAGIARIDFLAKNGVPQNSLFSVFSYRLRPFLE